MSRNPVTDLRYQAGMLADEVQQLVHRAQQVSALAVSVTEQDMVPIVTVAALIESLPAPSTDHDADFRTGYITAIADVMRILARLRSEGGANKE